MFQKKESLFFFLRGGLQLTVFPGGIVVSYRQLKQWLIMLEFLLKSSFVTRNPCLHTNSISYSLFCSFKKYIYILFRLCVFLLFCSFDEIYLFVQFFSYILMETTINEERKRTVLWRLRWIAVDQFTNNCCILFSELAWFLIDRWWDWKIKEEEEENGEKIQ